MKGENKMIKDYGAVILKLIDIQHKQWALERQKQLDAQPKTCLTIEDFVLSKCVFHLGNILIDYYQGLRDLTPDDYLIATESDICDFWEVISDIETEYKIEFTSQPLYALSKELDNLWHNGKVLDLIALTRKKIKEKEVKND